MSAKLFFPAGISIIPQMDFSANPTENGGWEATQSFLIKRSIAKTLAPIFARGNSICNIDPNALPEYRFLTLKKGEQSDHAPGVLKIHCTFTGYEKADSNGSSGEEVSVPTYSLRKDNEPLPLTEHHKWPALSDASKQRLTWLMNLPETVQFNMPTSEYGKHDETTGDFNAFPTGPGIWAIPTDDELQFARLIAQNKLTIESPAWTYTIRTEGSKGFTPSQLNAAGKIVENPPGNPPKPGTGWTWRFIGPDQEQSGEKRFVKDMQFKLIRDNDENQFLYGP